MTNIKYTSFKQVPVWEKAHILTLEVYKLTQVFPKIEVYGLISQIRRSASSIPANIAEGFYRNSTKELIQFLYNVRGSLGETKYHLRLSKDLNYLQKKDYEKLISEYEQIGKQLNGWIRSLKNKPSIISHKLSIVKSEGGDN